MIKAKNIFLFSLILTLAVVLIVEAYHSLCWRWVWDSAIMFYTGYLVHEFHYVPYRDFFDQNMIGTFLLHSVLVSIVGSKELFWRIADLSLLTILLMNTFLFLKKIDILFALFVSILSGFVFFYYGQSVSLQRDLFILIILTTSITVDSYVKNTNHKWFLISLLLGFCITIKPHSGIIYSFLIVKFIIEERKKRSFKSIIPTLLISLISFIAPLTLMFAFLWINNALYDFFDMATNYWKLFAHINRSIAYLEGYERATYLIKEFLKFGNHSFLFILIFFGNKFATEKRIRSQFFLLICFAVAFLIYPVLSGQFYPYHLFISFYFLILLSSFSVLPLFINERLGKFDFIMQLFLITIITLYVLPASLMLTQKNYANNPRINRVNTFIEYFRKEHVSKKTTVQPLDWVGGGAVNAMLVAGVKPGTRFIQDFFFYHSVSTPYIIRIRKEFINELNSNNPDYLIKIDTSVVEKPWVSGKNTSRKFIELDEFITKNYIEDLKSTDFIIYKLKSNLNK